MSSGSDDSSASQDADGASCSGGAGLNFVSGPNQQAGASATEPDATEAGATGMDPTEADATEATEEGATGLDSTEEGATGMDATGSGAMGRDATAAGAVMNLERIYFGEYRIEQYVQEVVDFSSQYGADFSISYTALNIVGRPAKYPEYGDFPETYSMRTYGDWWLKAPSRLCEFQTQNLPKIAVQDFIVIKFENYTVPETIAIFETYCPGAVVGIWAYAITEEWICLWQATELPSHPMNYSRVFSPVLKKQLLPAKIIRLEFNHSALRYFTEIDAVMIRGKRLTAHKTRNLLKQFERERKGNIVRQLEGMEFRLNFRGSYESRLREFFKNDFDRFISGSSKCDNTQDTDKKPDAPAIGLNDMPFEVLLDIFGYLDLASLFRVGRVSRTFYNISTQTVLYKDLNLKPYWHLINNNALATLAKRATALKKLDLSQCGLFNAISPTEFKKFIQQRGDSLTHLRLNSSRFLNASCVDTVGIVCDNLKELCLRNCFTDVHLNFSCLGNLKNLERLDLFRTFIVPELLMTMLENNRKLKHLNIAFSGFDLHMDIVAKQISQYNQQLVSLDMWKSHFLSTVGIEALSKCRDLEEVDFGWCLRDMPLQDSLKTFVTNCQKLKKLFLAAVRGITDQDVFCIASNCPNLEQLDLMSVLGISVERYIDVLTKCKKLSLLDISFCDNVDDELVVEWMQTYNVNIKHSRNAAGFVY